MSRHKLNKAYFRRQGNYVDGRKRYLLEKEIAGRIYTIALNPEKLWKLLSTKAYGEKILGDTDDDTPQNCTV